MDQKKIEEIILKIAKEHNIILDRKDPIFAVITANEVMFDEFITRIEKSLESHTKELEGMTAKYIADAKELAEVKIGAAVEETYKVLEKRHKLALEEISTATQTAVLELGKMQAHIKMNYWLLAFGGIATTLMGVFIGRLI